MKTLFTLVPLVFAITAQGPLHGQAPQDPPLAVVQAAEDTSHGQATRDLEQNPNFWMEQKLRLSKEMLTGLARADFDMLGKNAEFLRGLNRVEAFVLREPEGYRDELKQFDIATKALVQAAQDENLAAATLAFNQITISCASCHQQLREAQ